MQPPPARKGPYLKTLKHVHNEQVARLQAKNQHECDLLDDIRNFTKQRSVIEKSYAEALLKISSAYLNKKIPSIPDLRDEDEDEKWNVWNVWRTVLEENEKLARARLAAVEVFQQQITDDAKTIRHAKLQASRKCLEQLQTVQKELQLSVSELDRNKKFYFEEEHMAHDARMKASDAEEKLKKKKGSIFSSFTSLQRSSAKFSNKKEVCEEKSTGARNDYIFALAAANAHQDRYFNCDMDNCLRTLEGDVYDKLKEYLTILGRTELLTCSAAQNSFTKIRDQAQMLSRDYNVMCCVQYYPVLKQHIRYPFDACDGDNCRRITEDHGTSAALSREAKRWVTNISKEIKTIKANQRKLQVYQQLKDAGHRYDPDDPNGPDLDVKLDDLRENIRKAETEKVKSEGCIECLRDGGVNVEEWMKDVENITSGLDIPRSTSSTSVKTEASGEPPRQAETFYDSDSHDTSWDKGKENENRAELSEPDDDDIDAHVERAKIKRDRIESLVATWDDPTKLDWGDDDATSVTIEPPLTSPPIDVSQLDRRESWPTDPGATEPGAVKCVALYSYAAQNPDELSIVENEHLDLISEADGDGWIRARNYKGEEGYIPQNYVEMEGNTSAAGFPLQPQISFSSVDYHIQDSSSAVEVAEQEEITIAEDYPQTEEEIENSETNNISGQVNGITNGYPEPPEAEAEADDYFNQNLPEEIPITTAPTTVSSGLTTPFINECRGEETEGSFCRALYDYEATAPEELSFYEGQIIRIVRFTPHDENDGWWEGEYDGLKGMFPAIVVEESRWDGEPLSPEVMDEGEDDEELSDSGINPPAYTPPEVPGQLLPPEKVIITQATPEPPENLTEVTRSKPSSSSYSCDKPNFEMELNSDQQQKYQTQFGENGEPMVTITDVPDVMITEPDKDHDQDQFPDECGDSGLEVAQICVTVTAATPMTEEHKHFPGEGEVEEEAGSPPEDIVEPEIEPFADFSDIENALIGEDSSIVSTELQTITEEALPPELSGRLEDIPERLEEIEQIPTKTQELKSSLEQKKTSLEIEDKETRLSRGESGESPVTPEELDLHNLAKLESLKESDA